MDDPKRGQSEPMSVLAVEAELRGYQKSLEDRHRVRGLTKQQARQDVAKVLSLPVSTLDNARKGRLKDPLRILGLRDRLRAALVAELSKEIARLTHERDLLLATGADPRSDAMAQAEAGIKQAKEALNGSVK